MTLSRTMQALVFEEFGGPEVLSFRDMPMPSVRAGGVLVEMTAIGLNFADIYRRRGIYMLEGKAPHISGYEGVGRVVAVGEGVSDWKPGDRLGFADVAFAHASHVAVSADRAIPLPDDVDDATAAALLLQGLTAQYLLEDSVAVRAGHSILVHAAAGGVGRLITQMAVSRGVTVYGTGSTAGKRVLVCGNGAVEAYAYDEDWVTALRQTEGGGVDFAFDSIGTTLLRSVAALKPGGRAVLFGMADGKPPMIDPNELVADAKGIAGGDLWSYLTSKSERQARAARLFADLTAGRISPPEITTFALRDGAEAHRLLEDRSFAGKILLIP